MNFENTTLIEMEQRRIKYNTLYSNWYLTMSNENKIDLHDAYSELLIKKSDRIKYCLNYWEWDVYHKNKLMDLKRVNRCMNNRFCPNCRKWDLASAIHNLSKPLNKLLLEGYYPYLVTLTVPNVEGIELRHTIDKMNKAFKRLFGAYNYSLNGTTKGFDKRYIEVAAALKVLEITYNSIQDTYHPHFHCIFFSRDYDESILIKDIPGEWSNKRKSYNFYSLMDKQLMSIWTMYYNGQRLTTKNYNLIDISDLYICDLREMDASGIVEVLKYTFKDTDIVNYEVFKTIEISLDKKRLRQGYGLLYNLKLEGDAEGENLLLSEFLTEDANEDPEKIFTNEIEQLVNDYKEYRKISRTKAHDKQG